MTQPDGNILFQPISNNSTSINLGVYQPISITGTELFVQSQIQRFDDFSSNLVRYNGNPFIVGIRQSLFAYNQLKWDKRIEPMKFEEAKKQYASDLENISKQSAILFFDVLFHQESYKVETINLKNADKLLEIGRFDTRMLVFIKMNFLCLN